MTGRVVHFELPADDPARAYEFYRAAFGWNISSMPDMGYALISTAPTDDQGTPSEPGAINGGMLRRQSPVTTPVITIEVDDIDRSLETIRAQGGATVRPRAAVGQLGFAAYFTDSEGNVLGLWENAR